MPMIISTEKDKEIIYSLWVNLLRSSEEVRREILCRLAHGMVFHPSNMMPTIPDGTDAVRIVTDKMLSGEDDSLPSLIYTRKYADELAQDYRFTNCNYWAYYSDVVSLIPSSVNHSEPQ